MAHVKVFIAFLFFSLIYSMPIVSEAGNTDSQAANGTYILKQSNRRQPNNRPNAPSRQIVQCTYNGEIITLYFAISEGECEVQLTDLNSGNITNYYVDSSELATDIYVGSIEESYITILTDCGNIYYGVISNTDSY